MDVGPTLRGEPVGWPALRAYIEARDGRCVYATIASTVCDGRTELDHVPCPGRNALQKKAPDNERHLVSACAYHHRGGVVPVATTLVGRDHARGRLLRLEGACTACAQ